MRPTPSPSRPACAFTAHATATLVQEPMEVDDRVVAVRLDVDEVQDHGDPRGEVQAGVRWRWTDAAAQRRDAEIRAALRALG